MGTGLTAISPEEFSAWRSYIKELTGIYLDDTKGYLFESRFPPLLRELGCISFSELFFKVRQDLSRVLEKKVIDLITTGETSFFRDSSPFELFRFKILPDLIDRKNRSARPGEVPSLRIWSAACSTGQEIYTLAMVLKETLGVLDSWKIKLLGTDISDGALAKASYGVYNEIEIERGLPPDLRTRYFEVHPKGWKVRDEVRTMTAFQNLNLMQDFSFLGQWDVIFCRNVAIYFQEPERKSLFDRLGMRLEAGGCLVIGSTESLTGLCPQFEAHRYHRSVYYSLNAR